MPKQAAPSFNESELTKGQLRKLTALRKSLGQEIADDAFTKWLASQPTAAAEPEDPNARMIEEALVQLVNENGLRIPRGGYVLRRGRGRVIVERPAT